MRIAMASRAAPPFNSGVVGTIIDAYRRQSLIDDASLPHFQFVNFL